VIRAIVFDLDNTLVDFMKMKAAAVEAAIDGMIDAGLRLPREAVKERIDAIYLEQGLEYQRVFDELLEGELGQIDPKILASGIVAVPPRARLGDGAVSARRHDAARADEARHPARRRVRRAARTGVAAPVRPRACSTTSTPS
jgi:FMN phosphatase YigB (HAD superfamily)